MSVKECKGDVKQSKAAARESPPMQAAIISP